MPKAPRPPHAPSQALAQIEALPFTLSTGQSLQDLLAHETTLGPDAAITALREYRRYLALVLAAPADQPLMPSPRVAAVWRLHREDTRAYAKFITDTGSDRLHHHLARLAPQSDPAYTACRAAYAAAFGPPPVRWWPSPLMISLRLMAPSVALCGFVFGITFEHLHITGLAADLATFALWAGLGLLLTLPLGIKLHWSPRVSAPG